MTHREYFLDNLPPAYAARAIANTTEYYEPTLDRPVGILSGALRQAFIWGNSPEGLEFWVAVSKHLDLGFELPPIPGVEVEAPSFETRLSLLESRISVLESAACDTVPASTVIHYRLLNEGEVIREEDEVFLFRRWERMGDDCGVGQAFNPEEHLPIRRRISSHTDA